MNRTLLYGLLIVAFLAAGTGLVFQYQEIRDQRAVIQTASSVIESFEEKVDEQRGMIDDVLSINNDLTDDIDLLEENVSGLEASVAELEEVANSRRCQSIDLAQFENNIYRGTSYVITPAKMGWNGYWSIRENVILERYYGLARGFEFRIDLTPEDYGDYWQEIHTTIRSFSSAEEALEFFVELERTDSRLLKTSLDFGIPLDAWGASINDGAETMKIEFLCGNYEAEIKIKFLSDPAIALPILEQAATVIYGEISQWAP